MLKLFCIFDTNILFIGGHLLDFSGTLQKQWSKGDFYQKLVSFIKESVGEHCPWFVMHYCVAHAYKYMMCSNINIISIVY